MTKKFGDLFFIYFLDVQLKLGWDFCETELPLKFSGSATFVVSPSNLCDSCVDSIRQLGRMLILIECCELW